MARRRFFQKTGNQQSSDPSGGWQIVYTGFILIMLCFFIMLTSFASLQQSKITRFVNAFSVAVSVFQGGKSPERGKTMIDSGINMVDKEDQLARLFEKMRMISQQNDLDQVEIKKMRHGVVVTLSDNLLFPSGQAQLSDQAHLLLDKIGRIILELKVPVEIEGHTDNVPIQTAAFPSNWELSTARAVNVLRYLIDHFQVDASRISAVGRSEYQPVRANDSEENKARNRRVEFIFKPR